MWVGKDPELFPNCSLLDWEDEADREKMGSSMCSRRQKKIFQTLFFLTIVFGFLYGLLLYYEMHNQLKKAENLSLKYQQHQEALSAQLQVVYEHRSRLEKSLQKERNEHKKAKEDYLVYKLEAQESLNKEKQDSNSRFSALSVQHKMLKSQHEDLRKQYTDLHGEHVRLGEDHGRAMNEHSRQYLSLQQSKEQEIAKLKENIYNLFEENKKLRRAHQDVHVQLQDVRQLHKNLLVQHDQLQVTLEDHKNSLSVAQAQVEEYKQLRETLNKMPSLRQSEQKPPSFNDPHQGGADPRPYQERQGERGQVPYRADDKEREGEPSHVKPTVEEDDVPETRGGDGEEVRGQHPQHENWHRNPQPAEAEGEQTEEEGREHREWEREDKDHAVDQRDVHGQPDEGEDAESRPPDGQGVGNVEGERTEEHDQPTNSPSEKKYKSPYEEQLEQQRLAELREEEARRLKERQDALHQQRLREYMDRQQRMQQEEKRKEELARQEQFRRRADYHHDDATAETEDEHGVREEEEEEEADEDHNHHEEAEDQDPEIVNEQHQTEHEALKQQIDGNPDQQEDNLDEQYQDEEEADEKERGANEQEEEPVVEDPNQGEEKEDENYEEEPEEEDGEEDGEALAVKANQRAEM